MPKWYRLKWENPFEWSCRKPHSKGSEAANKEQNRPKGNICIQMTQEEQKRFQEKPSSKEVQPSKVHTSKI
jgi:hypothetical protein